MSAPTPTIIAGRYELQRRLAQGGMAEVWLAIDLSLDRKVAVKWLKPNLATDEIVAERFRREAVAAASLDHQHIVAVHDVFEQDGRQAVVMQLIEGKSLRQLLDAQKRLSPELTCHIGVAVAAALDHAHEAGFVHRDVKPANIMITADGRVLLTDFGIAKGLHGDGSDDLTSDNIMMGTAKYLSPEQVRGKKLDGRADLYSLGLVLYECLAGRVPFLGETDADTALARLQRDPTDLAQLRATLPRRLVATIHDLLARNPDRRPATGADLIVELELAREEGPPHIDPTNPDGGGERSPVAPFSAGRLLRAPSDLRGRATDRDRAVRGTTPPHGKQSRSSRRSPSTPTRRPTVPSPVAPAAGLETAGTTTAAGTATTDGTARIPGQPELITDRTATTDARASGQPAPARPGASGEEPSTRVAEQRPVRRNDPTPPVGTARTNPPPAKGLSHRLTPSLMIVGGLVTVALGLAVVIALTISFDGEQEASAPTSVVPGSDATTPANDAEPDAQADAEATGAGPDSAEDGSPAPGSDPTTDQVDGTADADVASANDVEAVSPASVSITSVRAYDPDGDGVEENELITNVLDGDAATTWRTSCYSNEWMGGKRGVGIVVSLDAASAAALAVDVVHDPSLVEFYATADDDIPTTFDAWGAPLGAAVASTSSATITSPVPSAPARHLLVLVQQLGPSSGCSDSNPFRGEISAIRLAG